MINNAGVSTDKNFFYDCHIDKYRGTRYIHVVLKGSEPLDITGQAGERGNYNRLEEEIKKTIGSQDIQKVLIDASDYKGEITDGAIGMLQFYSDTKKLAIAGIRGVNRKKLSRMTTITLAKSPEEGLEFILK